jgi:hypothetical protein
LIESAPAWSVMHDHFQIKYMPYLLLATAKSVRQA